jgi:hypothetical protein
MLDFGLRDVIRRSAALVLVALAVVVTGSLGDGSAAVERQAEHERAGSYLPLAVGNRWELRSRSAPDPMVFEVTGRDRDDFLVRWINPWFRGVFRFRPSGEQILLTGLDMGRGLGDIPARVVYFDFGVRQGDSWSTPVGRMTVLSRGGRVSTPLGEYQNTIEIRYTDQSRNSTYWTFAPGVGFVRFGQGRDAYLLTAVHTAGAPSRTEAPPPAIPAPRAGTAVPRRDSRVLIAVDPNPPANGPIDDRARRSAFDKAVAAGMTFAYVLPNWNAVEPKPDSFNFADVDLLAELAERHDLPIALNFRVLDAGQRAIPREYQQWSLDDRRLGERLETVLRQLAPHLRRRVRWITIGNEVDSYFNAHRNDVEPFARLLTSVAPTVRELFPGAPLSVNFTAGAASQMGRYGPILDRVDCLSFSYYPLNSDFTMKPPSVADDDIRRMIDAAGGRQVLFQEIGYASADRLNSSEMKQAEFLQNVFTALAAHADRVLAARVLFMSDLPKQVVDDLARYYKAPNSANFKAYIQTLGLIDGTGRPKPAWAVFEREATAFKRGGSPR